MSGSFTYCVPHRCSPCFNLSAKLPESAMLRTFRMVAGVLMRISYALRPRCPALRAGQREFSVLRLFCRHSSFWNRCTKQPPPDLSVLKGSASLRPGLIVSDFSGRPGPRAQQDFSKKPCFPISPQVFEYGKVRRWVLRTG